MPMFLATLLLAAAAATAATDPGESKHFNAWLDSTWEETLVREPISATSIGDPRYNDRIVDVTTAAWRDDNKRFIDRQLKELGGFNRQALACQDRLSYDVLKRDLHVVDASVRFIAERREAVPLQLAAPAAAVVAPKPAGREHRDMLTDVGAMA